MKKPILLYQKHSDLEQHQLLSVSHPTENCHRCSRPILCLYALFLFFFLFLTVVNVFILFRVLEPFHPPQRSPREFQSDHHDRLQHIIYSDSILTWTITNDKFFAELNLTDFVGTPDEIIKLHGLSKVEKVKEWRDRKQKFFVWETNICLAVRSFFQAGGIKPHVLFTYMNENRGAFSMDVPNRTIEWDELATHWTKWDCTDEEIWAYLDHPNCRAVFTTQHQSYSHPKVHSVPLGVSPQLTTKILSAIQLPSKERTQLLMINDNGWRHRTLITQRMKEIFANYRPDLPPLQNTYSKGVNASQQYVDELRRSKFLLTPSGLGWDCYRIWEALYMGVIPIVELYDRPVDAWRETLAELPVLWVNHYEDITPDLLEQEYLKIAARDYDYQTMTKQWWLKFFRSFVADDLAIFEQTRANHLEVLQSENPATSHLLHYYQQNKTIPRILHFVYVTPGLPLEQPPVPSEVKDQVDEWQRLHPDWMVILWDNTAMHEEFPDLVTLVKPIHTMSWISNLLRYYALEKYGGVYLDVDIVPLRSIDPLRARFADFSACEQPESDGPRQKVADYTVEYCGIVNNNVIGVPPHHPALQDVIQLAVTNTKARLFHFPNTGGPYELKTTGPPIWSRSAKKFELNILHPSLFYPCNWDHKEKCLKHLWRDQPHVYGMHEWKMSWAEG